MTSVNNSTMWVRFSFDDEKVARKGLKKGDIYYSIKEAFKEKGLPCVSDDEVLAFGDVGRKDDYGDIWSLIIALLKCDWFVDCVSSCFFSEEDEDGVERYEDILAQLPSVKDMLVM